VHAAASKVAAAIEVETAMQYSKWLNRLIAPAMLTACTWGLASCDQRTATRPSDKEPSGKEAAQQLPEGDALRQLLDETLDESYTRRLNLEDHAAWQILHGVLAFGREFRIEAEGGKQVFAVDYLLQGGKMKGWTMEPGDHGLRAVVEAGTKTGQGHQDQWLALLAQCGLKPDEKLVVGGRTYTMSEYVSQVQWDLPRNVMREYSWTLVGLTTYLPTSAKWKAMDGQEWSIERLMEIELDQEITTSACGGTHRLMGMAVSLNRHLSQGGRLEGVWAKADERIRSSIALTQRLQNPDGTFSTRFFDSRPGTSADLAQNLTATGHILEFVMLASSDEEAKAPWIKRAAVALCDILHTTRDLPLECGAVYHATHALVLYRERTFGSRTFAKPPSPQAE
jgi:hypothetical protein